jgi:hypothetical protein
MLEQHILSSLRNSGENVTGLGWTPIGYIFSLSNSTTNINSSTYVVANVSYSTFANYNITAFTPISKAHAYLLRNGITVIAQTALSDNSLFDVNYFAVPYNISGSWVTVDYIMFKEINSSSVPDCSALHNSAAPQQLAETSVYNLFSSQNYSTRGFMCSSYDVVSSR